MSNSSRTVFVFPSSTMIVPPPPVSGEKLVGSLPPTLATYTRLAFSSTASPKGWSSTVTLVTILSVLPSITVTMSGAAPVPGSPPDSPPTFAA